MSPRRPRLLVLNQYYWPGVEATAHLLTELCEALAADFDVTVVTGVLRGFDAKPGRATRNGVEIVRVRSTTFDRARLSLRAANYATYLVGSLLEAVRVERPDVVMCWTDPPMIATVGLAVARRKGAPLLVVSQDVFPEIAVQLRRLENPPLVALLRFLVRMYLKRADRVVAIGETMAERLVSKGVARNRLDVIPNWVDTNVLVPAPRDNLWAREHEFVGRFVVMHSGNVGHAQNLDALIRASTYLRDLDDLRIEIIGTGARYGEISTLAWRLEADAVHFDGYQPRETLSQSLGAADVHYVGLASGLAGFVVPSRLYGILAAGRPVLVAADPDSETARVVERIGCGVVVAPDRPEQIAAAIRRMRNGEYDLAGMGSRARQAVVAEAAKHVAIGRYKTLLEELARVDHSR
jgi:glycosyltransferase involved in cell wall biosynthesis